MGQAAVDLPDPLDQAPLGTAPSADDLLSQMAGEEVDRLLAEAELEQPLKPTPEATGVTNSAVAADPPASPVPETPAAPVAAQNTREVARALDEADPDTAKQLDALFAELNASPVEKDAEVQQAATTAAAKLADKASAAAEAASPQTAAAVDQQLDALFAQLNGAEAAPPQEPAAAAATEPPAAADAVDQQLDDLFTQLNGDEAASSPKPAAATEAPAAAANVDQQLNDLFAQLTDDEAAAPQASPIAEPTQKPEATEPPPTVQAAAAPSAPTAQPAVQAPTEAVVPAPAATEPARDVAAPASVAAAQAVAPAPPPADTKPPINPQEQTGQLEKQVLTAAIPTPMDGVDLVEPRETAPKPNRKPPLWLRLLEVFNAPLAALGDDMREAIGKLAIMTLVNAMALLTYVLIFRRH